jgi:H+/Cl- antiporter ClcA
MAEPPNIRNSSDIDGKSSVGAMVILAISFVVCGLSMYWSWNFVGPSGQTTEIGSFVLLWIREIVLFGFFGILFIICGFAWLFQRCRRLLSRNTNKL